MCGSLNEILQKNLNRHRLPILNKKQWGSLNGSYPKQEIKMAIVRCIIDHQAAFPFRIITHEKMAQEFRLLCHENPERFLIEDTDVLEKFDDYLFPYDKYGLCTVQLGHRYNDVSNFFMQEERYRCAGYNIDSPLKIWKDAAQLEKLCGALWRMNNDELTMSTYRGLFRLGAYVATQFKPHVARTIYHLSQAKNVLDMSCGWGDRLAAFYTSPTTKLYVGCDPNERTFEIYKTMCVEYEKLLTQKPPTILSSEDHFECHGKKSVILYRSPSESVEIDCLANDFDCLFTSPPYFSTERYNEGGINEHDQSWSRYHTYEEWRDHYFFPSLKKFTNKLNSTGAAFINIIDPVVNNVRYRVCDEMVNQMISGKMFFKGQIGMRIKQRPKKTKELLTFMKRHYIENIWCFSKNESWKFRGGSHNLEEFFS